MWGKKPNKMGHQWISRSPDALRTGIGIDWYERGGRQKKEHDAGRKSCTG